MKNQKINLRWIIRNTTTIQKISITFLAIMSSFEGVINGFFLGGISRLKSYSINEVVNFLVFSATAYFITYFGAYLFNVNTTFIEKKLNLNLRQLLVDSYLNSDGDNQKSSDVISQVTSTAKEIDNKYFMSIFNVIQVTAMTISSIFFVLSTHLVLGSIYILISFLSMVPAVLGQKKISTLAKNWQDYNGKMVQVIKDVLNGKRIIQNFFVEQNLGKYAGNAIQNESSSYQKYTAYNYFLQFISWLISVMSMILPVAIGLIMVANKLLNVTIGIVITLALTSDHVVAGIRELSTLQNTIKSTSKLREVSYPQTTKKENYPVIKNKDLKMTNVTYARGDKAILNNVSLKLSPQEKILISGASGVGKTTLINLLMGILKPDAGEITMGEVPVNRAEYTYIPQEAWVFDGTIRDNLTLFDKFDESQLKDIIARTGLNDLGNNPLEYECGPNGDHLSGGQKQRVSIARALLRNRELLILDEITSSLDKENSNSIRELIYGSKVRVIEVAHHYDDKLIKKYNIKHFVLMNAKLVSSSIF